MSLIIIILILLLFGADGLANAEWERVDIGPIEGVIVPEADADAPLFTSGDGYWTPTVAAVTSAEQAILRDVGELEHFRQYAGILRGGERLVHINGFCDPLGIAWDREPVLVDDGGDCYFTAVYNVETDEIERFVFNGEA